MYKIFDLNIHGGPLSKFEEELNRLCNEEGYNYVGILGPYCILLRKEEDKRENYFDNYMSGYASTFKNLIHDLKIDIT